MRTYIWLGMTAAALAAWFVPGTTLGSATDDPQTLVEAELRKADPVSEELRLTSAAALEPAGALPARKAVRIVYPSPYESRP